MMSTGGSVFVTLVVAAIQVGVQTVADFNLNDPLTNFQFMYHERFNLLLTLHAYGCYAAQIDGHLHDSLLQDFRFKLQEQVIAAVLDQDSSRKVPVSIAEFRNMFGDPLADAYCYDKDIYIISLDYLACDFEKYLTPCAWSKDYSHRLQWNVQKGGTPSILTGPDVDHTLQSGQGQFIYVEANEGAAGDVAELWSPVVRVNKTKGLCMRFWYNMFGNDVETLQVLAKYLNNPNQNRTLWTMSKNQGRGWKLVEVTVPGVPLSTADDDVQLVLKAHRGSTHLSDIAVDDISSSPGLCAPASLNCSFEDPAVDGGFCGGWTQVKTDNMDWTRVNGQASSGNGPDHALKHGHSSNDYYLYLTGGQAGFKAELLSNKLHLQGPICLTFYYYMKGLQLGELEVVQVDESGRENIQFTRTSADQTTDWTPFRMTITASDPDSPIQLKFRAFRSGNPESVIAIDLVAGLSGACEQYPDETPTPPIG